MTEKKTQSWKNAKTGTCKQQRQQQHCKLNGKGLWTDQETWKVIPLLNKDEGATGRLQNIQ